MKTRWARMDIRYSNTAIRDAETSTVHVLPKISDIPEASLAGRGTKRVGKKGNLLFGSDLRTARKTTVCFLGPVVQNPD